MNKTATTGGMSINLGKGEDVSFVGLAGDLAWIRLSNGTHIEMTREQLVAIVAGYEKMLGTEKILAQLAN